MGKDYSVCFCDGNAAEKQNVIYSDKSKVTFQTSKYGRFALCFTPSNVVQFVSDDAIYYQEDNIETSTISLPTPPTKNGYEFLGWYTQADGHGNKFDDTTTIISNMVVYAYWINSQKIFRNGVVKNPTAPTKDGYTFAGWYTDKDLTVEYDFTSKVTKSFTLYAKWNDVKSDDGTEATPAPTGEPTTEPQPTAKPDDTAKSMPFTDVNAGDWFYNNVQYV